VEQLPVLEVHVAARTDRLRAQGAYRLRAGHRPDRSRPTTLRIRLATHAAKRPPHQRNEIHRADISSPERRRVMPRRALEPTTRDAAIPSGRA
jgi:hypothetical protein